MRTLLYGMALSAVIAAPAMAETRYDRNLEKAVLDIVAGKMGDIRGGFSYKQVRSSSSCRTLSRRRRLLPSVRASRLPAIAMTVWRRPSSGRFREPSSRSNSRKVCSGFPSGIA